MNKLSLPLFTTLLLLIILFNTGIGGGMVQAQAVDGENDGIPTAEKGMRLAARFDEQDHLRVIVQLKVPGQTKSGELMTPSIHQAQRDVLGDVKSGRVRVIHEYDYIPFMAVEVDRAAFEALQKNPNVIGIEEDVLMKPMLTESVPLIGADDVWLEGVTGAGQVVAILDTGVDKNHPALAGKVVEEACYSSNGVPGESSLCPGGVSSSTLINSALPYVGNCPPGECDHGTHVAGIVAGEGIFLGKPVVGVAPDAKLIAIQVFTKVDDPSFCDSYEPCVGSYPSDQLAGLQRIYDLRNSFSIAAVNLSLGGGYYDDQAYCDLANSAYKAKVDLLKSVGIATIAASGNNGYTNGLSSPACISSVISVGATTKLDEVAYYSNASSFLDLLAPGGDYDVNAPQKAILSTIPNNSYGYMPGTSMATPHVAGAWALLKSFRPGVSVDELLEILKSTGVPILDTRNQFNFPRIDVLAAKNELSDLTLIPSPSLPIEIQINWHDVYDDETGYLIERRMDVSDSWDPLTTTGPSIETYLDSNDLVCEQPYQYQVTPVIDNGFGSPTPFGQTYSLLCAPETVEKLSSTQKRLLINWSDSSNLETSYKVERYVSGNTWENLIDNLPANTTQHEHLNLTCSTSYIYRITAINGASENVSKEASFSTNACDIIAQPQNLMGSVFSLSSINLVWDDVVDDETGYRLERKISGTDTWNKVIDLDENITNWTDSGLVAYQTYDYQVIATNNDYESLPSSPITITVEFPHVYLPLIVK